LKYTVADILPDNSIVSPDRATPSFAVFKVAYGITNIAPLSFIFVGTVVASAEK